MLPVTFTVEGKKRVARVTMHMECVSGCFTPFQQMSYKKMISDVLFFAVVFFLDKSAEGCDARALLRERGEAWRAEAAWMTRCCDVWCVDDRCASIESRSGVYMQQWPAQPGAYTLWATVCQVTWCVCVCVAWPWSCRFMHGSTKRHTLFFLSRTLACAYILVPCYISLAPCRVSRGDLRQSSVHMCRGVWCSVFFSARYSIETSLKEKY